MNDLEQKQRFTAVSRVEKRLDDVELLLSALAGEIVTDRTHLEARMQDIAALFAKVEQDATERWLSASATHKRLGDAQLAFESMTFWQRLRWLVGV